MIEDKYSLILKARAQISGISKLAVDQEEIEISGWQLSCLLEPIERNLSQALELLNSNPTNNRVQDMVRSISQNQPFGSTRREGD